MDVIKENANSGFVWPVSVEADINTSCKRKSSPNTGGEFSLINSLLIKLM